MRVTLHLNYPNSLPFGQICERKKTIATYTERNAISRLRGAPETALHFTAPATLSVHTSHTLSLCRVSTPFERTRAPACIRPAARSQSESNKGEMCLESAAVVVSPLYYGLSAGTSGSDDMGLPFFPVTSSSPRVFSSISGEPTTKT